MTVRVCGTVSFCTRLLVKLVKLVKLPHKRDKHATLEGCLGQYLYFFTSKASKLSREREKERARARGREGERSFSQYVYFFTSKASRLSTCPMDSSVRSASQALFFL
jgi:hypothetical protein